MGVLCVQANKVYKTGRVRSETLNARDTLPDDSGRGRTGVKVGDDHLGFVGDRRLGVVVRVEVICLRRFVGSVQSRNLSSSEAL